MLILQKIKNLFNKYLIFNFLFLVFIASSWALFNTQFFRTHDYVHGVRIAEMSRALADGHFPVRWSQNFGFGFGMPLFQFYAPLPYYIGSLFYFLGFNLILSTKILFLIANLGTLLGAYYLAKKLFNSQWAGVIASAALTLAPYRAVNLFIRGALGEAWGMMAMPWILYSTILVVQNKKLEIKNFIILTLSLVVLMLSHNLSILMFLPFALLFTLIYLFINKKLEFKIIYQLFFSYLLAIGLSSFYLIPAFLEKHLTQIETILSGYFHYSNHFLYIRQFLLPNWGFGGSAWGPNDDISFFLGFGQLIGLAASGFLVAIYFIKNKTHKIKNLLLYFTLLVFFITSLFFTLLKSKIFWDSLPLLNFIQFPWRFMSVGILFLSLILSLNIKFIKNKLLKFLYIYLIFIILIIFNFAYFRPEKFSDMKPLYYDDPEQTSLQMSDILRDYVPKQMSLKGEKLKQAWQNFKYPENTKILINKTQQKLYSFNLKKAQSVEFPIAYFPGWQAEINGQQAKVQTSQNGLVSLNLPVGQSQLGLSFGHNNIKLIADIISAISLIIFLFILINASYSHQNKISQGKR